MRPPLCLLARTSHRLAFSTVVYILLRALREFGLQGTPLARAQADTIRLRLLKIGVVVRVTVRKVWIALPDTYPWQEVFAQVYEQLTVWRMPRLTWDTG